MAFFIFEPYSLLYISSFENGKGKNGYHMDIQKLIFKRELNRGSYSLYPLVMKKNL